MILGSDLQLEKWIDNSHPLLSSLGSVPLKSVSDQVMLSYNWYIENIPATETSPALWYHPDAPKKSFNSPLGVLNFRDIFLRDSKL